MVEALAMLGLIAMVTPMLYRKAAERTTELQDINVASQIRMVSAAVDAYLKDNYTNLADRDDTFLIKTGDDASDDEQKDYDGVSAYLPEGFNLDRASKLFNEFEIAVRKDSATDLNGNERPVFTSAVVASLKDDMTKVRAAKIASMIGTNGGIVSNEDGDYWLNGTQGTWRTTPNQFGFSDEPDWRENSLVSISSEAISSAVGDVNADEALFRVWKGTPDKNTMTTSLFIGGGDTVALELQGHNINDVNNLIVNGDTSLNGEVITPISLRGDLIFRGADRAIQQVTQINMGGAEEQDIKIDGGGGNIENFANISAESFHGGSFEGTTGTFSGDVISTEGNISASNGTVSGKKLEAGSDGIVTDGDLEMNGHNIRNIGEAFGDTAHFKNVLVDDHIDMNGGHIDNTVYIIMSGGEESFIDMNEGAIRNLGQLEMAGDIVMHGHDITEVGKIFGETAEFSDVIANNSVTSPKGTFDDLHAKNYLTVGGNTHNQGTVLEVKTANNGTAFFKTNQFGVGMHGQSAYNNDANKIVIDSSGTFVGYHAGSQQGLYANSNSVFVGYRGGNVGLYSTDAGSAISYDNVAMKVSKNGVLVGEHGDIESFINEIPDEVPNASNPSVLSDRSEGVYISRSGAIELQTPTESTSDQTGFVRARRLVSDIKYTPSSYGGSDDAWSGENDRYYEVNPAYTSVMNDIKLASRGGARLSDILPDYINKGIYVADNTYADAEGFTWEDASGGLPGNDVESAATECSNCDTSPWLGFVPAPLCPPAYESVITLEPMRWKMAEAYALGDPNYNYTSGADLQGNNFENIFWRDPNPSSMEISVSEAGDGTHTATISGYPFVFQTNTWLNTSVYSHVDDGYTDGWHAVMGFLYDANSEEMYKRRTGASNWPETDGIPDIIWNLFPVRDQELAAIARVYCSFRRYKDDNWTWGDDSPVFKYDQLQHTKTSKDSDWITQANDPTLSDYKTEW